MRPGHIRVQMILRNTGDVRRAVWSQLLQRATVLGWREMCWGTMLTLQALHYVFVCVWAYVPKYEDLFKAKSSGEFGIHLLLMCYQHASFWNGAASDIVHKPASASLKSPLSQNSTGLLYLTDAQESLSHHGNTFQSATATDNGINKDGCLSTPESIEEFASLCLCVWETFWYIIRRPVRVFKLTVSAVRRRQLSSYLHCSWRIEHS